MQRVTKCLGQLSKTTKTKKEKKKERKRKRGGAVATLRLLEPRVLSAPTEVPYQSFIRSTVTDKRSSLQKRPRLSVCRRRIAKLPYDQKNKNARPYLTEKRLYRTRHIYTHIYIYTYIYVYISFFYIHMYIYRVRSIVLPKRSQKYFPLTPFRFSFQRFSLPIELREQHARGQQVFLGRRMPQYSFLHRTRKSA